MKGFTLIELVVVLALVALFTGLAIPALRIAQRGSALNDESLSMVAVLRLAQSRTVSSEQASKYGVFFDMSTSPDRYVLFRGETYAARDVASDEVHALPVSVEIAGTTLPGAETVFQKVSGAASGAGSITLRLVLNPEKEEQVYVSTSGAIQRTSVFMPSDAERQKDSRHVHFSYTGRTITAATERLRFVFSSTTYDIVITNAMEDGQIFWQGDVLVDGETQTLQIQTHRLNDPVLGTQFSIIRDKSKNTKAVTIEISGDDTGDLIRYDAQGQTTKGNSFYVSIPLWQ
jgi:prepilin-type N-terminal cleavage/methylation domain-containing protein